MDDLTLIQRNGNWYADSREVAAMIDKKHCHLMRDIYGYIENLKNSSFDYHDFFIHSSYRVKNNTRKYGCFLITRDGCGMIVNEMTGKKGALFTASYVTKFNEKEAIEKMDELQIVFNYQGCN